MSSGVNWTFSLEHLHLTKSRIWTYDLLEMFNRLVISKIGVH